MIGKLEKRLKGRKTPNYVRGLNHWRVLKLFETHLTLVTRRVAEVYNISRSDAQYALAKAYAEGEISRVWVEGKGHSHFEYFMTPAQRRAFFGVLSGEVDVTIHQKVSRNNPRPALKIHRTIPEDTFRRPNVSVSVSTKTELLR